MNTTTREKSARARAEARQRAKRRRLWIIVGSSVAVLAVVAGIVLVAALGGGNDGKSSAGGDRTSGDAVYRAVSTVPQSVLDQIGKGDATSPPQAIQDDPLVQDGKPHVLYVGAEYCPYCAAQRWAFVQAMSRFGTFSNLDLTTSAAADVYPSTPTFTFHGAGYTSKWLAFTGKELYTNQPKGNSYVPLDTLTAEEEQIFTSHTQAFPFIDIAGRFRIDGSTYKPDPLQGLTAREISNAMSDPTSAVAKGVDGAANVITAALCQVTDNKPAAVCTAPAVTAVSGG